MQLPTSDPKSANSRYFQGHQLIKPYFHHKVSCQMIAQFNSCQYGSRNITSGFDRLRKPIYRRLFNIDKKQESISINKIVCPLLTRIISYQAAEVVWVQLEHFVQFPSPFNEDHFISANRYTMPAKVSTGFRPLLTRIISYLTARIKIKQPDKGCFRPLLTRIISYRNNV